ncbi:hypothetical protein LIER_24370 [Lithospermum erythrorhizon]|uniref:Retroviral polymerase SH3-like domain-containing protein n=1 Tax=Lithospermum erythrorhizon TaxID=34254 RepID=A0AAV3R2C1_LITER
MSHFSPVGLSQHNGMPEKSNMTLLDIVKSMMSQFDLPINFLKFALQIAGFTLNKYPTKSTEKSPQKLWFEKAPTLVFLRIWRCEAYVKKLTRDKLGTKFDISYFIGYPKETVGYYFYLKHDNKIFIDRT